jgi:hypothetical protein
VKFSGVLFKSYQAIDENIAIDGRLFEVKGPILSID